MSNGQKEKVITPIFRVSFPNVFEKKAFQGGTAKYSLVMLFPKEFDDEEEQFRFDEMRRIANKALRDKWSSDESFNRVKDKLKNPFRDGDVEKPDIDGYQSATFVVASSLIQPPIVDSSLEEIINPDDFYAGCYARAEVNAYAFDTAGNRGVSFGVNCIMKVKDGESFGGRTDPKSAFGAFKTEKTTSQPQTKTNNDLF
jgi:hypothetical protein